MNTWGRSCIRLSHQIALQYTTQLSVENYTLVTVQHIRETNSTYYGNGSTKPFRIYGLHIWSTFNAYTKNRCKVQNIFNELCAQSYIDVLAQGRSISIGLATGTLQSCNKPTDGWVNNRDLGDLRRHPAHYDVTVMFRENFCCCTTRKWRTDPWSIMLTAHHLTCIFIFIAADYARYGWNPNRRPISKKLGLITILLISSLPTKQISIHSTGSHYNEPGDIRHRVTKKSIFTIFTLGGTGCKTYASK